MRDWKLWLIVPVLCAWPLATNADDSEAATLTAECGAQDMPQASVDSCLERVRILEETEPSAQLQSLEGRLEKRERGETLARSESTSAPQADTSRPAPVAPLSRAGNPYAPEIQDQDNSQNLSGSEADDQPPIADPPSGTAEDQSRGEQPEPPE